MRKLFLTGLHLLGDQRLIAASAAALCLAALPSAASAGEARSHGDRHDGYEASHDDGDKSYGRGWYAKDRKFPMNPPGWKRAFERANEHARHFRPRPDSC